jgi:ABC-type Fe3+ transport system permease subunit
MTRTFDFYEYAGVIVPGAVLMLGLCFLFPDARDMLGKDGLTFGEFGVFVIVAYAVGQLVQGIGNFIDFVVRRQSFRDGRHADLVESLAHAV